MIRRGKSGGLRELSRFVSINIIQFNYTFIQKNWFIPKRKEELFKEKNIFPRSLHANVSLLETLFCHHLTVLFQCLIQYLTVMVGSWVDVASP